MNEKIVGLTHWHPHSLVISMTMSCKQKTTDLTWNRTCSIILCTGSKSLRPVCVSHFSVCLRPTPPSHLTLLQIDSTGFARNVFVCGMYVDILKAAPSSIQTSDSLTSDTYGFLRARTAITHVFISRLLHYMYYRCSQVHWPMSPYVWCHKCCIHKDTHARQSFRFVKNVM